MRITPGPLALLLLVAACQTEPPPPSSDTDTDTDLPEPPPDTAEEPPPWQLTEQVGQLFIIDQAGNATIDPAFNVYGMFGDQLQGYATAPWCLAANICFTALPAEDDAFVDGGAAKLDPFGTLWSWNGHSLEVAGQAVPFEYDPIVGYGWYLHEGESIERDPEFEIKFEGEWGRHRSKVSIEPMELLEPVAGIALPARAPTTIRWVPTDGDSVYLRLKTPDTDRLYRLKDDGAFDFDPRDFGIADLSSEEYSFSLQRWNTNDVDVHGNTLTVHGIWQQHFDFLTCEPDDYPIGALGPAVPPLVPVMPAERVKVGFQLVIDDGKVHDFFLDDDLDGKESLFSATLHFTILDNAGGELCTVVYDASSASHAGAPAPVSGGGTIFEAWTFGPLSSGQHDCTIVDDKIYGTKDVRQRIQKSTWGFGIGTVAATTDALKGEFNWNQWQSLLAGAYISRDGEWHEVGGVASSGLESCGSVHSGLQALPKPTQEPLPARFYTATPVVSFPL